MSAQDFGKALVACRSFVSHLVLATRLLSLPDYTLPSSISSAELADLLVDIEAGGPWPFALDDLNPFMLAVQKCLPQRSVSADTALRIATAVYFYDLSSSAQPSP
jgi:hypothetical protein